MKVVKKSICILILFFSLFSMIGANTAYAKGKAFTLDKDKATIVLVSAGAGLVIGAVVVSSAVLFYFKCSKDGKVKIIKKKPKLDDKFLASNKKDDGDEQDEDGDDFDRFFPPVDEDLERRRAEQGYDRLQGDVGNLTEEDVLEQTIERSLDRSNDYDPDENMQNVIRLQVFQLGRTVDLTSMMQEISRREIGQNQMNSKEELAFDQFKKDGFYGI